jgi:AraC-like DNA-binding protein
MKRSMKQTANRDRSASASIGFALPDTQATVAMLIEVIGNSIIPGIQNTTPFNLIVADRTLHVEMLEPLPGRPSNGKAQNLPEVRRKGRLRDQWHKDRFFGFFHVAQGEADLLLCQKIVTCREGHLTFILPKAQRSYGAASHWERPDVDVAHSDLFWFFISNAGGSVHMCWSRGAQHAVSPILFVPDSGLLPLVELLAAEVANDEPSAAARMLLWLIFDRLRRNLVLGKGYPHHDDEQPHRDLQQVPTHSVSERARHYIEANLGERLTLSKVARAIYTSRTTLAQTFHQDTGETFTTYLTRRRLELAQHLIKTTTMRMAEIAFHCGFSKPQYFSDTFRRHFGMTPSEFRKNGL